MSSLTYALLSVLARGEATGYDIAKRMERPVGHFWQSARSAIYPELNALEADGLVTSRAEDGPGPRPKKTYAISEAGLEHLREWLRTPINRPPVRDEASLRLYSSWLLAPHERRAFIESERARLIGLLEMWEPAMAELQARATDVDSQDFAQLSVVASGVFGARGEVAWADWLLAQLPEE